jgi:hypothetical protein
MHHSRRIRQLEELWQNEWKNQVFDHFVQKQKHLSDREKADWRRARDLEKKRWEEFQRKLEPVYAQLGNRLNAAVVRAFGKTFYERIEQIMLAFVAVVRRQCVLGPENFERAKRQEAREALLELEERDRQAAAAEAAAAADGPPPPIPPKSSKRRQRSLTSVSQSDLKQIQEALRQMSLSAPAGGSAPAQTRPLPPVPAPAQAGPSSSSSAFGSDDRAAVAAAADIERAFRPPSRSSSAASSSDEDSESEDETPCSAGTCKTPAGAGSTRIAPIVPGPAIQGPPQCSSSPWNQVLQTGNHRPRRPGTRLITGLKNDSLRPGAT